MRQRPQRMSAALRRRLALAGFVMGGVLAVLVNQDATGQAEQEPPVVNAQHDGPIELGRVDWIRNYEEGVAQAEETGKPMLLLFQEVPG
ncbi:hypothetical protein OT109_19200 [Phycisphaeraceae bacterium D3-23]